MMLDLMRGASNNTNMLRFLGQVALTVFLLLLALATGEFVNHASTLGWAGLWGQVPGSRLMSPNQIANFGIFLHMMSGAVITVLAPLQLIPVVRRKLPSAHRWGGRILVSLAIVTALGGLTYIVLHGTVGGPRMSLAFGVYGMLVLICAGQTIRYARLSRWQLHQDWALRLFFLAIASWIYRVHYAIWVPLTDRAAMTRDFSGAFDQFNLWAFFLPYLVVLELVLMRCGRGLFHHRKNLAT